jgi:2-polyprenyl-3-methyl-5-hydroxy-6-metoxy-1,4-benzoquinol methylase
MNKDLVRNAFDQDAEAWILDGYRYDGHNYPTALDRLRIVRHQVNMCGTNLRVADLGCGGGDVSIELAKSGHAVDGVDASIKMIEFAAKKSLESEQDITGKVEFHCGDLEKNGLQDHQYDIVVSMGVIGYLESDDILFREAQRLLKPGGLLFVSCRNRLFNMVSLSHRTHNEVANGSAEALLSELGEIDTTVPVSDAEKVVSSLKRIVDELPDKYEEKQESEESPSEAVGLKYEIVDQMEARQHTPKLLDLNAKEFGFIALQHFGVHPHLLNPRLNKALPAALFNKISDCLLPLASLPISLTWSSVFIGMYKAKDA